MSPKLKFALICRCSDRGFALPIAIGIGFVFLLIAATLVMRSQGDQVTASAQKATARSLGTAETGVTRVQSLLNEYGILASTTLIDLPTSPTSSSWKQIYVNSTPSACGSSGAATKIEGYRLNEWETLSDGSKFKITEYTYKPNSSPSDTTQITANVTIPANGSVALTISSSTYLTDGSSVDIQIQGIQGTLKRTGSNYSFTRLIPGTATSITAPAIVYPTTTPGIATLKAEGQINDSIASSNLEVNIPVQAGDISSVPVPGVFLNSGGTGNNTIKGNVLLRDCSVDKTEIKIEKDPSTDRPYIDPDTGQEYKADYTKVSFPDLPPKPTFPSSHILGSINTGSHDALVFPRGGDTPNANGVYEYSVSSINLHNSSSLTITAGQKVTFYLDGSIAKGGDIIHNCSGVTGCKPTDFKIFGYSSTGEICTNGNNYIEAFIFAPSYKVGVAGSGGSVGGFKGSVWVDDWSNGGSCGSNSGNTVVVQTGSWTDLGLTPKNLPPKIAPLTSWQKQESL
jgi:archaellum component FlaF (FlaF/FlaG flagellin family)